MWQAVDNPEIVDRVGELVAAARAAGDLVVWVLHAEPGTGTRVRPGERARPADGRAGRPTLGEPVLTKTSHNAFTTTNLHQLLTEPRRAGDRGVRDPHRAVLRDDRPASAATSAST